MSEKKLVVKKRGRPKGAPNKKKLVMPGARKIKEKIKKIEEKNKGLVAMPSGEVIEKTIEDYKKTVENKKISKTPGMACRSLTPKEKDVDEYALTLTEIFNQESLTSQMKRFCEEYVSCYDPEKAALNAGYNAFYAHPIGHQILKNPLVKKLIEQLELEISQKLMITKERVLQEYAKFAFFNMKDFYDDDGEFKEIQKLTDEQAAAIQSVDYVAGKNKKGEDCRVIKTIKFVDKKANLDALAKYLGLFENDNNRKVTVDVTIKQLVASFPAEMQQTIRQELTKRISYE